MGAGGSVGAALGALDIDANAQRKCFDGATAAEVRAIAEKLKSLAAAAERAAACCVAPAEETRVRPAAVDYDAEPEAAEWRKYGGEELDGLLASGAVALLDGEWLVAYAAVEGAIIRRRQELPPEAFVDPRELRATERDLHTGLNVACCSYPWLQPDHPDPKGETLRLLARLLKAYVENEKNVSCDGKRKRWGLFWDFASLHQHPEGGKRTPEEDALFKAGLQGLGTLYSHANTTVFRLTKMPEDYPSAYKLPEGANTAAYNDRGWCFTESSWASLTKVFDKSLDLGMLTDAACNKTAITDACTKDGGRKAPLAPADFAAAVESKSFTNGKDDKPLVAKLYADAFAEQFGKAERLTYYGLGWGDTEAEQLARALAATGSLPRLKGLFLSQNKIGDAGTVALAGAIGGGATPALERVNIYGNQIGDAGATALAEALGGGGTPELNELYLFANQIGDAGAAALAKAMGGGALPKLVELSLSDNKIGDAGAAALAKAMGGGALPKLVDLSLKNNKIDDAGAAALAEAVGGDALPALKRLSVSYPARDNEQLKAACEARGVRLT